MNTIEFTEHLKNFLTLLFRVIQHVFDVIQRPLLVNPGVARGASILDLEVEIIASVSSESRARVCIAFMPISMSYDCTRRPEDY